jgi:hypothetical protein
MGGVARAGRRRAGRAPCLRRALSALCPLEQTKPPGLNSFLHRSFSPLVDGRERFAKHYGICRASIERIDNFASVFAACAAHTEECRRCTWERDEAQIEKRSWAKPHRVSGNIRRAELCLSSGRLRSGQISAHAQADSLQRDHNKTQTG